MIREKSVRCEKRARCEKLRKNSAQEITQKLTTRILRFDYFLEQLNFIPYRTKKSFCLVHNYCFYCETVRDAKHGKSVS